MIPKTVASQVRAEGFFFDIQMLFSQRELFANIPCTFNFLVQSCLHVTEPGVGGPHGQSVTKAAMAEREEDIGTVTTPYLCMVELTALDNGSRQRIVTHRDVQVSERCEPR